MKLQERKCPVCDTSEASSTFLEAGFSESQMTEFSFSSRKLPEGMHLRMLLCKRCDILYASPAPSPEWLAAAYGKAAYDSKEEADWAAKTYQWLIGRLIPRLSSFNGALDIGAGHGAFLERLIESGFTNVQGIEASAAPIREARPGIRPLIRHGMFSASDFAEGSFSLVTCFQTLEHVDQVGDLLRSVHGLLRPGGAFVTVSHNYKAISARLMGHRSPIYDIEHLQLFSIPGMRAMLESTGYNSVITEPVSNTYPLHYWLKLVPLPQEAKLKAINFSKKYSVGFLPIPVRAGNMFAAGFRKIE